MTPLDLLILTAAAYLLTDAMVNRALPFGIMTRIRDRWQTDWLRCWYCFVWSAGVIVYVVWLIEPRLIYPVAAAGLATLSWRYTGANHT